jgi:hypothetical protein
LNYDLGQAIVDAPDLFQDYRTIDKSEYKITMPIYENTINALYEFKK